MEDVVDVVITAITDNWIPANVDNTTPTIKAIYELKETHYLRGDFVLAYSKSHSETPVGVGYSYIDYKDTVSIDIRTFVSRARLIKLRDEVRRIIYASRKNGTGGYKLWRVDSIIDLSDRSKGLWRMVIDITLWKIMIAIPS